MKILLTGGSGDLGQTLAPRLLDQGDTPVILDIRAPRDLKPEAVFIRGLSWTGSKLQDAMLGCDCIVHIAAWHGIHESRGEKDAYDFFDLNVRGTFEVFEAAVSLGINRIVYISTTSVNKPSTLYGRSKILAERIAEDYVRYNDMNVITLRPRAFIPHWNHTAYANFIEWARWFWRGAVHIDDVASAVLLSLDLISRRRLGEHPVLTLDGAYEYTDADLEQWDATVPVRHSGNTIPNIMIWLSHADWIRELNRSRLDITETVRWLGYKPSYSLASLLAELAAYGDAGPPQFSR